MTQMHMWVCESCEWISPRFNLDSTDDRWDIDILAMQNMFDGHEQLAHPRRGSNGLLYRVNVIGQRVFTGSRRTAGITRIESTHPRT